MKQRLGCPGAHHDLSGYCESRRRLDPKNESGSETCLKSVSDGYPLDHIVSDVDRSRRDRGDEEGSLLAMGARKRC